MTPKMVTVALRQKGRLGAIMTAEVDGILLEAHHVLLPGDDCEATFGVSVCHPIGDGRYFIETDNEQFASFSKLGHIFNNRKEMRKNRRRKSLRRLKYTQERYGDAG